MVKKGAVTGSPKPTPHGLSRATLPDQSWAACPVSADLCADRKASSSAPEPHVIRVGAIGQGCDHRGSR